LTDELERDHARLALSLKIRVAVRIRDLHRKLSTGASVDQRCSG